MQNFIFLALLAQTLTWKGVVFIPHELNVHKKEHEK